MTAASFDLTTVLYALRERAAEQGRDGLCGDTASRIALMAYGWLGDNIGAFVADQAVAPAEAGDEGEFAADSNAALAAQCRMQARESLDPDLEAFMYAVAARLLADARKAAWRDDPNAWRSIAEADREIATILELGEMILRNSLPIWARDSDGRVFQAVWTDHKNGYWWDIDGECRADPVEFYPHPLDVRP